MSTYLCDALTHSDQTKMSVGAVMWIEATAIILHAQLHTVSNIIQIHVQMSSARMLDGISKRLLSDTQQIVFNCAAQLPVRAADLHLRLNRRTRNKTFGGFAQCARQITTF